MKEIRRGQITQSSNPKRIYKKIKYGKMKIEGGKVFNIMIVKENFYLILYE